METKQLPTFPSPAAKGYPSSTYLWLREAFFVLPWKLPIPAPPQGAVKGFRVLASWEILKHSQSDNTSHDGSSLVVQQLKDCEVSLLQQLKDCKVSLLRLPSVLWCWLGNFCMQGQKKNHLVNQILPGLSWKSSHFIWESHSESQTFWHITLSKFTDVYKKNASNQIHIYIFGYWHSFFKC